MFNIALASQTWNAAFALMGLPFIFGGIFGVMYRLEVNMRLYLYYTGISFLIDMGHLILHLVLHDACTMLPSIFQQQGEAFACGFARISAIIFIVAASVLEGYCVYTIWSFCQDLKAGGTGGRLPDLLACAGQVKRARMQHKDYHSGLYPISTGHAAGIYGSGGTGASIGGGKKLFGGHFHETAYPPKLV